MTTIRSALKENLLDKEEIRGNVLNKNSKKNSYSDNKIYKYRVALTIYIVAIVIILPLWYGSKSFDSTNDMQSQNSKPEKEEMFTTNTDKLEQNPLLQGVESSTASMIEDQEKGINNNIVDMAYISEKLKYNDRVYSSLYKDDVDISYESAIELKDKELGTTLKKVEWNTESTEIYNNYSTLALDTKFYSIKGYDKDFRLITYGNNEIYVFQTLDKINIDTGKNLVELLKLNNNVEKMQLYDSYAIYGGKTLHNVNLNLNYTPFIETLSNSYKVPTSEEIYANEVDATNAKVLAVTSKEGIVSRFILYGKGYVNYFNNLFRTNYSEFNKFYNEL